MSATGPAADASISTEAVVAVEADLSNEDAL